MPYTAFLYLLRYEGVKPALSDSEVITIEIVGEFLGMDEDKAIWEFFKTHYLHFSQKYLVEQLSSGEKQI